MKGNWRISDSTSARYCVSLEEFARVANRALWKGFPQPPLTRSQCDFSQRSHSAPMHNATLRLTISDSAALASLCAFTHKQKANMSFLQFHGHLVQTSRKHKPVIMSVSLAKSTFSWHTTRICAFHCMFFLSNKPIWTLSIRHLILCASRICSAQLQRT